MPVGPGFETLTFEDYCFLVKDGQKADLIDGVLYMASPETAKANQLSPWLLNLVSGFVEACHLGVVYCCRVAFKFDSWNGLEPDIAIVKRENV